MATPKTWVATDIATGKLTLTRVAHPDTGQPAIRFEQRYEFVDAGAAVLRDIAGGRLTGEIEIAALPPTVAAALQTIGAWLYAQCVAQEGMQEP